MIFEKKGSQGGDSGVTFNDGVYDCVRKVIVGEDSRGVAYIKMEYRKDENVVTCKYGRIMGTQITEYPNEYITMITGSHRYDYRYNTNTVCELQFLTSHRRISQRFGEAFGFSKSLFQLEGKNGAKLGGFHGRSGDVLDAIGGFFLGLRKVRIGEDGDRLMTMLRITTKRQTSQVLGHNSDEYEGTKFVLDMNDHKIVGFHGRTSLMLEQIGVYVKPINNT